MRILNASEFSIHIIIGNDLQLVFLLYLAKFRGCTINIGGNTRRREGLGFFARPKILLLVLQFLILLFLLLFFIVRLGSVSKMFEQHEFGIFEFFKESICLN